MVQKIFLALIFIGAAMLAASLTNGFEWDEAHHANSALFSYNLVKHWLKEPTFSLQKIREFAVDYHSHYKFFTVFAVYPPLDMILSATFYLFLGVSLLTIKLPTVLASIALLYFVFKLSKLYSEDKLLPFLSVLFLAFHPVYFEESTRNHLEILLSLFFVATVYFFVRFLRTQETKQLYFASASLGLSLATKPVLPLLLLALFLTVILERKVHLFSGRKIAGAFLTFLLASSPFLLQLVALRSFGLTSELFVEKWTESASSREVWLYKWLPSFELDKPVFASEVHTYEGSYSDFQEFTKNATALLFQWYLIPFFFIGLYCSLRRNKEIDKISVLLPAIFVYIFTVKVHSYTLKHITPAIPFVVIILCLGLAEFLESVKRFKMPIVAFFLFFSLFQTFSYYESARAMHLPISTFDEAAEYLISEVKEPTTVLSTYEQMQMFAFAKWDMERKIYGMYLPLTKLEWEKAINGDFSYYPNYQSWKKFGIEHPRPRYVVIHEQRIKSKRYDYHLEYFNSQPERFKLVKVIEGKASQEKTFIYRIQEAQA